jgi:hypothetical protein
LRRLGHESFQPLSATGVPRPKLQTKYSRADHALSLYQERAKASQGGKGKLGKQLDAQRSQTQSDTLKQTARDNVAVRDADSGAQARQWN